MLAATCGMPTRREGLPSKGWCRERRQLCWEVAQEKKAVRFQSDSKTLRITARQVCSVFPEVIIDHFVGPRT